MIVKTICGLYLRDFGGSEPRGPRVRFPVYTLCPNFTPGVDLVDPNLARVDEYDAIPSTTTLSIVGSRNSMT